MTVELDKQVHELLGHCIHKKTIIIPLIKDMLNTRQCSACGERYIRDGMFPKYSSDLNLAWPLLRKIVDMLCDIVEESKVDYFVHKVCNLNIYASSSEFATYICGKFVKVKSRMEDFDAV